MASYFMRVQIQFMSEITSPYSTRSVISDILAIDILEIWIKKSVI